MPFILYAYQKPDLFLIEEMTQDCCFFYEKLYFDFAIISEIKQQLHEKEKNRNIHNEYLSTFRLFKVY